MTDESLDGPWVNEVIAAGRPRSPDGTRLKLSDIVIDANAALVDSIDTSLTDLSGMRLKELVYENLARNVLLAREDIPNHLPEFCKFLKTTFGTAATPLERFMARRLYATLGWKFLDIKGFGLHDHFELVQGIIKRARDRDSVE